MADGKHAPAAGAAAGGGTKDGLVLGITEKTGLLDESKDQQYLENSIPLSPQWLYTKQTDGKDPRLHGAFLESVEKGDVRHPEANVDKRERLRSGLDVEGGHRWFEEERETSLFGRRDRKKELDREAEYRKNDRRAENAASRENPESRPIASSERWTDVASRSVNDGRRDAKWSLRWGPEDKEKENRTEKKADLEKDDAPSEKPSAPNARPTLEPDARDKWRPRHRQEGLGSVTPYRAPGFGERGRGKETNPGFTVGRGRSSANLVSSLSNIPSSRPIGAHRTSGLSVEAFRYPRGKLLDIYRQKKETSSFDRSQWGGEDVSGFVLSTATPPLAFVSPDMDEEGVLEDIRKGIITRSDVIDPSDDQVAVTDERETELCMSGEVRDKSRSLLGAFEIDDSPGFISENDAFYDMKALSSDLHKPLEDLHGDIFVDSDKARYSLQNGKKQERLLSTSVDIKQPLVSLGLVDTLVQDTAKLAISCSDPDVEVKLTELPVPPEELSLLYQDPQGGVQGPFLGVDIISWFEEGYFNIDLPVRLSDAPEGTSFQPLGEIMPHLLSHPNALPSIPSGGTPQSTLDPTSASVGVPLAAVPSATVDAKASSDSSQSITFPSSWKVVQASPLQPDFRNLAISDAEEQYLKHDTNPQDADEVLYTGRPNSRTNKLLADPGNGTNESLWTPPDQISNSHEIVDVNMPLHDAPRNSELTSLGLFWSELKGATSKQPLSSNVPVANQQFSKRPSDVVNSRLEQLSREVPQVSDEWLANANHRRFESLHEANRGVPHIEAELNRFNFEDRMMEELRMRQHKGRALAHQNIDISGAYQDQLFDSLNSRQSMNKQTPASFLRAPSEFEQLQQIQQQHHRQQQQLQMQLQQQQQEQQKLQRELILQQMIQHQLLGGTNVGPLGVDHLEQALRREQLNDRQQHSRLHQRHHDIDQFGQSNFGQNVRPDVMDVRARLNQRQMVEQQLLGFQHEQFQAQVRADQMRSARSLRQQSAVEEDRHAGGAWPVEDPGQYMRATSSLNDALRLEIMQQLQRSPSLEQHGHPDWNLILKDSLVREAQGIHALERATSMAATGANPNTDVMNALARLHGLELPEQQKDIFPLAQRTTYPSGVHSQLAHVSEPYPAHLGRLERHWPEPDVQLQDKLRESIIGQMQMGAAKQREKELNLSAAENPHLWGSLGSDRNFEQNFGELMQQKQSIHSQQSLGFGDGAVVSPFGRNESHHIPPSMTESLLSSLDRLRFDGPLSERSVHSRTGLGTHEGLGISGGDSLANALESTGKMGFRVGPADNIFPHALEKQKSDLAISANSASGNLVGDLVELKRRQGSVGKLAGEEGFFSEELLTSNWPDGAGSVVGSRTFLKRTPEQRASSVTSLTDLPSPTVDPRKNLNAIPNLRRPPIERKQDPSAIPGAAQATEIPPPNSKKDGGAPLPRMASSPDSDASGPSFMEIVKKPAAQPDGGPDATDQGHKAVKKRSKKGKQIDPSLLGFKVHSNRIMMGEIQRADDV